MSHASEPEIRALVRELLRDLLPAIDHTPAPRRVRIQDDAGLQGFITQLITLLDDPSSGAQLRSGQIKFVLDDEPDRDHQPTGPRVGTPLAQPAAPASPSPVLEVERGAVTERLIAKAAADGARVVLGPRAVLTPLAREQARKTGVEVERKPC